MTHQALVHQVKVSMLLWLATMIFLSQGYRLSDALRYDILLGVLVEQGKLAAITGVVFGLVAALLERSLQCGGFMLLGVSYGCFVGGAFGIAIGGLISYVPRPPDQITIFDADRIILNIIGLLIWLVGQVIGIAWAGTLASDWWTIDSRRK